ncbi:MAG TPA: hypothetical protein VL523_08275, partial [Terriglobia bacterium]|nr:hypothetical protein [Terriglobia bacterium]
SFEGIPGLSGPPVLSYHLLFQQDAGIARLPQMECYCFQQDAEFVRNILNSRARLAGWGASKTP